MYYSGFFGTTFSALKQSKLPFLLQRIFGEENGIILLFYNVLLHGKGGKWSESKGLRQKRVFEPVLCGYWFFIRNNQFLVFFKNFRIREPWALVFWKSWNKRTIGLDISKTSMTQRFSWMNRQFWWLFDFSKEIEEWDYISELALSLVFF